MKIFEIFQNNTKIMTIIIEVYVVFITCCGVSATTTTDTNCGAVPEVLNGNVTERAGTTYGSLADVTCNSGYSPISKTIQCLYFAMWETPRCEILDCGAVPEVFNGVVTLSEHASSTYGSLAYVNCNSGYIPISRTIKCLGTGRWETPRCLILNCGAVPEVLNGNVTERAGTTYGSLADVTCNSGYSPISKTIQCLYFAMWETPRCEILENNKLTSLPNCGAVPEVFNGVVTLSEHASSTYGSLAYVNCNSGYIPISRTIKCLGTGRWETPRCLILNCGAVPTVWNGAVTLPKGFNTTYGTFANVSCNRGYKPLSKTIKCLPTGRWEPPHCEIIKGQTIVKCLQDTDSRGITWPETIAGNTNDKRCQDGFTGYSRRRCGPDKVWEMPHYNCIRETIIKIIQDVSNLNENATVGEINNILMEMLNATSSNETLYSNNSLTDGELSALITSLDTISNILKAPPDIINREITEAFFEIVSNLVDASNQNGWLTLSQSGAYDDSEKILKSVDTLAQVLHRIPADGSENNGIFLVTKNIAIEVKRVSNMYIIFPDPDKSVPDKNDENTIWFKETSSSLRLDTNALINSSVTYTTTAVIYRDMSKILPSHRNSDTNESLNDSENVINAPILSLTITPPVSYQLNPPLRLTYAHFQKNYTEPWCVFWVFTKGRHMNGFWSSEGCVARTKTTKYTVCECNHLTNFAVLMSPFIEADAASKTLRIISIIGIGISIVGVMVTLIIHICLWRHLRNDRTIALLNLCVALLLAYILFLAGIDRTEISVVCAVIAAVLQYIYLVVFCIMLVEGIQIAIIVLYVFKPKSRIQLMLVLAWVTPGIIVGISLGVTQVDGYGNDKYCWLSVDNGLIWAFVGPALLIITLNIICLLIVMRVMFQTRAMKIKTTLEKIQTSFKSLCVLVPVLGVSWILGIFYIDESLYFVQYVFAILNGLQGVFIFLIHCLLNAQVKTAFRLFRRRRSSAKESFLKEDKKTNNLKDIGTSIDESGKSSNVGDVDDNVGNKKELEPQILKTGGMGASS